MGGRERNLCHIRNIQPVCVSVADLDNDNGVFLKAPVMHRKSRFSTYFGLGVQTSHWGDTEGIYGWWMRTIVMLMRSDASDDPQSGIIYELAPRWIHTSSSGDTKKSEDYQTAYEKSALKKRSYQRFFSAG